MIAQKADKLARSLLALLLLASLSLVFTDRCHGYIIPAKQLINFMAENFSKFKTLLIVQSTQQENKRYEMWQESFMEKIWMKSPNLFHSKILERTGARYIDPDVAYRQLLIANSGQRLMWLLSAMGINLHSVSLTRNDGVIAYRIGDIEAERPKLLIEKERFLPILLIYRSSVNSVRGTIKVHFKEYRKLYQGWYPFEITYSDGSEVREGYTIHNLQANVPIDPTHFEVSRPRFHRDQPTEPGQVSQEEERLREIIKTFEEKYR